MRPDRPVRRADAQKRGTLRLTQANPDKNLIRHLKREAEGVEYLVLWLDNDKEGENICFEVIDTVLTSMKKTAFQQVFRAKFSSITRKDILFAFESLSEEPNKNQSSLR